MPTLRVVLDTNVLVSGLAYPRGVPGRILAEWRRGSIDVVLSRWILDEMVRVLPRLSRVQLSGNEIRDLAESFLFLVELVDASGTHEPHLRDPDDQPVLQTLIASKADYLITGDKDLLVLGDRYRIITPGEFWARHGG